MKFVDDDDDDDIGTGFTGQMTQPTGREHGPLPI